MMKHLFKFTRILAVAAAAVCMLGFSACNDEPYQHTNETAAKLEEELILTADSLQAQIDDLQAQIIAAACHCQIKTPEDVAKIVNDSLQNYWNINQVQNFVNTELSNYVLMTTYQTMVDSLRGALNDINTHLKQHCDSIGQLYVDVANLNTAVINAQNTANAAKALAERDSVRIDNLNDSITAHRTIINQINNTVSNLAGRVSTLEGQMTAVIDSASKANALARMDSIRIDALQTLYNNLEARTDSQQVQIDSIITVIDSLATKAEVRAVKAHADSLYNVAIHYSDSLHTIVMDTLNTFDVRITKLENIMPIVRDSLKLLDGKIDTLQQQLDSLCLVVAENTRKIDALTATVKDVFSKTIYSVMVQGTYNPVFGYFALPTGMQSNVLMAYYGENEHYTEFPTESTSDLVYDEYPLTAADVAMLGTYETFTAPGQTTFLGDGANAGKIFMHVNPNTADLTDAEFTLVNTIDEEAGIKLDSLRPSTEKLTFGYTGPINRASVAGQAANGFYEAEAALDEAGIPIAKIQVDDRLKQAVKDFYNNNIKGQSDRQVASNLSHLSTYTGLAQGIYQQFNGFMPRYAVKAHWTDSLGAHDVYSNAVVAAAAVKPLSYAFFKDRSLRHLPNISPISDLSNFHIDMKNIHFNINFHIDSVHANIHLAAITINLDTVDVVVVVPDMAAYQADPTAPIVYKNDTVDLRELQNYFNDRFATVITSWNDGINHEIDQQVNGLIGEINKQVNDFATDIQGQLNNNLQQVVDSAVQQVTNKFGGYVDKLNKVIGKINGAINRVNRFLDNPNKFLQTVLIYEGVDRNFHIMSTDKNFPTVFNGNGAIMLYPTSFNAEIAAPAFKKFVAVTNVYKGGTSAQDGDAACIAALNAANSNSGDFKKILQGGRYGVAFVPATGGYTYEIFYSALDYCGRISQRKYYVTVK